VCFSICSELFIVSLCLSGAAVTHILCVCEAIAYLKFCHLDQFFFMEPSVYYYAPINKVLHIILSVGLIKGQSKEEAE
jgi:hypothetical protein